AIAAVSSYLAERSMVTQGAPPASYKSLSKDRRGLLRFSVSGNRYAGMGALLMQYPSPYLAGAGDPLRLARAEGSVVPAEQAVGTVAARIQADLDRLAVATDPARSRRDPRWYWAAVGLLDAANHPGLMDWLEDPSENGLSGVTRQASHREDASGFEKVVERFVTFVKSPAPLGAPPDDLAEVLARVALGAPGVCALRALGRQVPGAGPTDPDVLRAAAAIGEGFRTLFNLPETMGLLGAFERHRAAGDDEEDDHYWRRCVDHGLEGNLQAVLDEQAHVLRESLGLSGDDRSVDEVVHGIAGDLSDALSVRTANVFAEELRRAEGPDSAGWIHRDHDALAFRTRFGLRLGELREDDKRTHRIDTVRKAFNSPFRPFLLASTSVGQEGLDFHTWCHVIYHWNLPGNPVDMEQREGRVHRYKGLAVRRNIARAFRTGVLRGDWDGVGDPWSWMFDRARDERDAELDDLVPFWLFTDVPDGAPTAVERRVPIVPLSREAQRYQALKRSLVLYRLAFGQPRQDDLVNWLQQQLGDEAAGLVEGWRIDLRAP
ncbi:MAG: helicase-related protein, partial [Myxococcota bacterium]|nr:helicase-related protein [Myxococcota bacterium]